MTLLAFDSCHFLVDSRISYGWFSLVNANYLMNNLLVNISNATIIPVQCATKYQQLIKMKRMQTPLQFLVHVMDAII